MALVYAVELWDGRRGSQELAGRRRTYTRVFEVRTDDPQNGPVGITGAAGIPLFGASHPDDAGAIVQKITPQQHADDPTLWTVTVDYDSKIDFPNGQTPDGSTPSSDPQALPQNPLLQPPVWRVSFNTTQEALRTANKWDRTTGLTVAGSEDIVNSAGLPFDPPVMIDVSRPVVIVTRNLADFQLVQAVALQDCVNKTAWRGVPPRCARCTGYESESANENGVNFWRVTYHLALKFDTWDIRVLDAGYHELIPQTTDKPAFWQKITDNAGREPSAPAPLDGSGKKLPPRTTPTDLTYPPIFKVFRTYREVDFNTAIV